MLRTRTATPLRSIRPSHGSSPNLRNVHHSLPNGQTSSPGILPALHPTVKDKNGVKSLRLRQHGHPPLPMPPFMDPALMAAREKHLQPKPEVQETEVEDDGNDLGSNPFALALATPVRYCSVSRARLPTHFLQAVSTVWDTEESAKQESADETRKGSRRPRLKARLAVSSPERHPANDAPRVASYMLNRRDMLDNLGHKKRWAILVNRRMVDHFARRAGKQANSVTGKNDWDWDDDAADKALENLRSGAMRKLRRLAQWNPDLFGALDAAQGIPDDAACMLVLGRGETILNVPQSIPTYNLRELLGDTLDEMIPDLLKSADSWYIRRHQQTAHVQMGFERIRAYMDATRISLQ